MPLQRAGSGPSTERTDLRESKNEALKRSSFQQSHISMLEGALASPPATARLGMDQLFVAKVALGELAGIRRFWKED